MTLIHKARQNRETALAAVRARQNAAFAAAFNLNRRRALADQ